MTLKQRIDALIRLFSVDIQGAFLSAIADIVDNVILSNLMQAIEDGNFEGAFAAIGYSQAAIRPLIKSIETSFERGGEFTGSTFPKYLNTSNGKGVFRFDVRNSRAEAYLRDKSSSLIVRIEDEARTNVRSVLTDSMQRGVNPRTTALDIVGRVDPTSGRRTGGIIGLTNQQEGWVRNTRIDLESLNPNYFNRELRDKRFDGTVRKAIQDGKQLPRDTIDKLVTRYKDKALKYRGEMIGRTEALQALNASEYEAVKQAVELGAAKESAVKRIWDSAGDNRVRWSHRKMDGQKVGLDEPFVSPSGARLLHPGDTSLGASAAEVVACRCRAKTAIDWLADLD